MTTELEFPVLYILMRTDLASMNSGKGMAQASHASNAFWKRINDTIFDTSLPVDHVKNRIERLANQWQLETDQGFGTVIVLGVTEAEMRLAVKNAQKLRYVSEIIHDPTYPLVDGDTVHYIPLDTCAYVFGDKNDPMTAFLVGKFKLHP